MCKNSLLIFFQSTIYKDFPLLSFIFKSSSIIKGSIHEKLIFITLALLMEQLCEFFSLKAEMIFLPTLFLSY